MATNGHKQAQTDGAMTRRDMLRAVGRYGVLAGVVVSLTVLVGRGGCGEGELPCQRCGRFDGCDLEKAQAARQAREVPRG